MGVLDMIHIQAYTAEDVLGFFIVGCGDGKEWLTMAAAMSNPEWMG
jgi:hypothetical protein